MQSHAAMHYVACHMHVNIVNSNSGIFFASIHPHAWSVKMSVIEQHTRFLQVTRHLPPRFIPQHEPALLRRCSTPRVWLGVPLAPDATRRPASAVSKASLQLA